MTTAEIVYAVLGVVGPWLLHKIGAVDLSGLFASPAAPSPLPYPLPPTPTTQLPPALLPTPKHPVVEMWERELEAVALQAIRSRLSGITTPVVPNVPSPATPS